MLDKTATKEGEEMLTLCLVEDMWMNTCRRESHGRSMGVEETWVKSHFKM